jgi:uracil-DNA glycosylase family protein
LVQVTEALNTGSAASRAIFGSLERLSTVVDASVRRSRCGPVRLLRSQPGRGSSIMVRSSSLGHRPQRAPRTNGAAMAITPPTAAAWVPQHPTMTALRKAAEECRGCELWEPATQVVFSTGRARAPVVLVGEQPGDVEDKQGVPFVGPAGRLLMAALDEAGFDRSDLYLTNAVKHFRFRQVGKRRIHEKPELAHVRACRPWLTAELQVLKPQVVVILGASAASSLLGKDFRVTQHRGEVIEADTDAGRLRVVPTVHPSSVLRAPAGTRSEARAALVADLRVAAGAYQAS